MPILALDTSTMVSGVAVSTRQTLLAELSQQTGKTHSERLMPHISTVLDMAGLEVSELRAIAVSIGPGSFTGLRIGLATAKAMCYAAGIPLIGVPTLEALAYACPAPGTILSPMLDAQKGNVYQAVYKWDGGYRPTEIIAPRVIDFDNALVSLKELGVPVMLLGEIVAERQEELKRDSAQLTVCLPCILMPRAASVAALAHVMLAEGRTDDVMTLEPLYIRRSEAEVLWERRQGGCS